MNKFKKIHLVTDDEPVGAGAAEALPGPFAGPEDELMDQLLRRTADELTREADFEGIRLRAVKAAEKKLARRERVRKAVRGALFTAASFLLCFAVIAVVKNAKNDPNSGKTIFANNNPAETRNNNGDIVTSVPSDVYVRRLDAGTVDGQEDVSEAVAEMFPENLPSGMTTMVDENSARTCALGVDSKGGEVTYVCSMESTSPIKLGLGEAGSVVDGDELTYYWQLSEGSFLSVRFTGFDREQADAMFYSLTQRMIELTPAPAETDAQE